ncbi:hypothetical protein MMC11_004312 [Xylographa trunciseda]|nr:hypothetical protein [Xylographa trunciseda]
MASKLPLKRTIYTGTFIHSLSLDAIEVVEHGIIGVDEKGVIAFVEKGDTHAEPKETVRSRHGWEEWETVRMGDGTSTTFFFPGFVDTHIHASQLPNAGIFGKSTLLSWLHTYTFPLESSLATLPRASTVYNHAVASTLRHGTTTAAYFATTHVPATTLLASICHERGQRAFIGRCNMDSHIHPAYYKDADAESALRDTRDSIKAIKEVDDGEGLVVPILTPRFAPSCTAELLSGLGELQKETGLRVQTHISENLSEVALVQQLFPEQSSYTEVYDTHGLLGPETVLAHACHLSKEEVQLVKARGASVSHCPVSNSYLGSGLCPVRELLQAGIPVGLGTDVSGGWSCSILAAAREAGGVSRLRTYAEKEARYGAEQGKGEVEREHMKLSVEECLFLATRGGAECLGLGRTVGAFEVGMEWDAQLVDLGAETREDGSGGRGGVALWGGEGWEERVAKWVYCGDERNTRRVWVRGREGVKDVGSRVVSDTYADVMKC